MWGRGEGPSPQQASKKKIESAPCSSLPVPPSSPPPVKGGTDGGGGQGLRVALFLCWLCSLPAQQGKGGPIKKDGVCGDTETRLPCRDGGEGGGGREAAGGGGGGRGSRGVRRIHKTGSASVLPKDKGVLALAGGGHVGPDPLPCVCGRVLVGRGEGGACSPPLLIKGGKRLVCVLIGKSALSGQQPGQRKGGGGGILRVCRYKRPRRGKRDSPILQVVRGGGGGGREEKRGVGGKKKGKKLLRTRPPALTKSRVRGERSA